MTIYVVQEVSDRESLLREWCSDLDTAEAKAKEFCEEISEDESVEGTDWRVDVFKMEVDDNLADDEINDLIDDEEEFGYYPEISYDADSFEEE